MVMFKYIVKRSIISLLAIWVLITATFFLIKIIPGDPLSSDKLTPQIRQNLEKYYGLDKPLGEQYVIYLSNLLKGDMGYSFTYKNRTVNEIIGQAFPKSAQLGLMSLTLATVIGLILGIVAALNQNGFGDYFSIFISVIGVSVPSFIAGALLQYLFASKLGWFPIAQWKGPKYWVLPTISLALGTIAQISRIMRSNMLEVSGQDYIKTAKAKGLSPFRVTYSHRVRNAILPVITILGPAAAALLTGTFVVESIFAVPGLGKYYVQSIQMLDYTMVLGLTIFYGSFLIILNFFIDIIYGFIDPRIRIGK